MFLVCPTSGGLNTTASPVVGLLILIAFDFLGNGKPGDGIIGEGPPLIPPGTNSLALGVNDVVGRAEAGVEGIEGGTLVLI